MKIIHIHRKPRPGFHSIENIYAYVRKEINNIDDKATLEVLHLPYTCDKHWNKLLNIFYVLWFSLKNKIDIYHITGDAHYVALGLIGRKTVISVHSVLGGRPKMYGAKYWIYKLLYFSIPQWLGVRWTIVSEYTRNELADYLKIAKSSIEVIYNPLLPCFKADGRPFNETYPTLLHIGMNSRKNFEGLVSAITSINCHLLIVGHLSVNDIDLLTQHKISYSNVPSASPDKMFELYQQADIVTIVSFNESFGMPIIEGQAVGRPVICGDVTAMPEIGGDGVYWVNPHIIKDITTGILALTSNKNLRNQLLQAGQKNIKRFELTLISKKYYSLYQHLLKK